jgi:hypothetical protein
MRLGRVVEGETIVEWLIDEKPVFEVGFEFDFAVYEKAIFEAESEVESVFGFAGYEKAIFEVESEVDFAVSSSSSQHRHSQPPN